MGNSLRCCLACVLPCGALDVVRVVHLNGHVEEYNRRISAGEILAAHPDHVLSKPCTPSQAAGVPRRIFVVSPDSDLKRGHIYFLIPSSTLPDQKKKTTKEGKNRKMKHVRVVSHGDGCLPEKRSSQHSRRRRSGRVGVWRPHLESICEDF